MQMLNDFLLGRKFPGLRAHGGAFAPTLIAGLVSWHDFGNADSVTYDGGTFAISLVDDLSGNDRSMFQPDSARQPAYDVAGGYMHTDGGDRMGMFWDTPDAYTIILKAKYDDLSGSSTNSLVAAGTGGTEQTNFSSGGYLRSAGAGVTVEGAGTTNDFFMAIAYGENGAASSVWIDETEYTGTRATPINSSIMLFLGGDAYAPLGTRIYEVAIYSRKLDTSEIAQLRDYFNA